MAESNNSGHLSQGARPAKMKEDRPAGPVPMRHLLKLGRNGLEVQKNPFGADPPSHKSSIANGGKKGW